MILIRNIIPKISYIEEYNKILQSYVNQQTAEQFSLEISYSSSAGFTEDLSDVPDGSVYSYSSSASLNGGYYYYPIYLVSHNSDFSLNVRATGLKFDIEEFVGFDLNVFLTYLSSHGVPVDLNYSINRVTFEWHTTYSEVDTYVDENNLYPEPVDNSNQFQLLNSLNQASGSHLTSDDYHDIMAIEAYNRNYLLAHLQPNVTGNLEVTGDINATTSGSGSGGGSSTDVSGIVTQLQNISNKLTYIHNNNDSVNLAELLYYVAEALEYGLTFDDEQQIKHSFLDELNKKLEYTQTIDNESVTKNITQTLTDTKDTIANSETTVINNLDYSDRISSKPKTSGYPDDDLLI